MNNANIFRAYDIRGNSKTNLTPETAYEIGYSFVKFNTFGSRHLVCVGRDGRLSSPILQQALIEGLLDSGIGKIINIGLVPTPALYFADRKHGADGSIMVTGSHNPKDDNGFKMLVENRPFFGDQISQLYLRILQDRENRPVSRIGTTEEVDINNEFVEQILSGINISPDLKVAFDPGNGAAGGVLELLIKRLPNKNLMINGEINGEFPNHHPDPSVAANLRQLIEFTKENQCDIGLAFDGDADRLGIVTSSGQVVTSDQIMYFFARDIIKENTEAQIVVDVKTSQVVFDLVAGLRGRISMCKTGHPFIKRVMKEKGALFGAEASGHIMFADRYYGYDDGIYAALRFLELFSKSNKTLDQMRAELPKAYNTPEFKIKVPDERKFVLIEEIKEEIKSIGKRFNDTDGLRVQTEHGWWLLRASNTEGAISGRCEATSSEGLEILKNELEKILSVYGFNLRFE